MKVLFSKEMVDIDRKTIEEYKISGLILMENAGMSVAHFIMKNYPDKKIAVFVGSGNNGGDGLVIARHLFLNNYKVTLFYVGDKKNTTKSNKKNFIICKKLNIPIINIKDHKSFEKNKEFINQHEVIIDAILGIGLSTPLAGHYSDIIKYINELADKIKIAVDIPTGLFADTPVIKSEVFRADTTITFGLPKISHVLSPARNFIGELIVKNISFPRELLKNNELKINLITRDIVRAYLPLRISTYHKNDFGNVVIFAGSVGKSGAAVLASESSLKAGAGLVTAIIPSEINDILENNLTEGMTLPVHLDETEESFKKCQALFEKADVILAGCGITTDEGAELFLKKILSLKNKTIILDADALNIVANDLSVLKGENDFILTPHIGEMSRLTKKKGVEIINNRIQTASEFAIMHNVVLVLKSSETIIADKNGDIYINNAGNEGMATAGSGDVLSGVIAGLSAQNIKQNRPVFQSAVAGTFLHSLAGDFALKEKGSFSLVASDIINNLNKAFASC